jgi:hypothetical protein
MSNHVHLIAIPQTPQALSQSLKQAHGRYAAYWNVQHSSTGHVWQGRFYSCPLAKAMDGCGVAAIPRGRRIGSRVKPTAAIHAHRALIGDCGFRGGSGGINFASARSAKGRATQETFNGPQTKRTHIGRLTFCLGSEKRVNVPSVPRFQSKSVREVLGRFVNHVSGLDALSKDRCHGPSTRGSWAINQAKLSPRQYRTALAKSARTVHPL